jgi:hypothetical protein
LTLANQKETMKISITSLFALFVVGMMLAAMGCREEPCEGVECLNDGICIDGLCDCPEGFTGSRCEVNLDPCLIKDCVNADTCFVNNQNVALCVCNDGFEGDRCDSTWSQKYQGRFEVTESCNNSNFFEVEVLTGPRFNEVTVVNFNDQAARGESRVVVEAVNGSALEIREQFMEFGQVSGVGSFLNHSTFNLQYTIITDVDTLSCDAVFRRVL